MVFDRDNIPLTPYQTENKYGVRYTYYRSQNYSKHQLNISEDKLIDKANEYMEKFENLPMHIIQGFGLQITNKVAEGRKQMNIEKQTISREIGEREKSIINLQDKYVANKIDDTTFTDMLTRYNENKRQLELKSEKIDKQHKSFEDLSYSLVKLLENLSQTYKEGTLADKSRILKSIQVKLFYDEIDLLYIKQNPMLEALDFGKNETDF